MMTQPHTDNGAAEIAARLREITGRLREADAECLDSIGDTEAYHEATERRRTLRADARNLSEQLYALDETTWRAIEGAAATINDTTTTEETTTMKTTKTTATKTATKGSSKKSSKQAAAAPRDLTVEYDSEAARLRAEVEAREDENADTLADASAAFDNVAPAAAKGGKKNTAARKGGKVSAETHDKAAAVVAETSEALTAQAAATATATAGEGQPASRRAPRQQRAAAGQPQNGGSRAEKLTAAALSIFDRINAATPEQPVTRGDLASNSDRNIARGLFRLELVVRLDEGGIRYHAKKGVKAKDAHERIRAEVTNTPATFA